MIQQPQINILQRVKVFLGVEEDYNSSDLYSMLKEYRNQIHPDRFTDEEHKKSAEEKFKEAQQLLSELFKYLQDERLHCKPTELMLYKPIYDNIMNQAALDAANQEILNLKQQLEWKEYEIDKLQKELNDERKQEFETERKKLEEIYKPGIRGWSSLSVTLLLSGMFIIITKIENVSVIIKRYSPINEKYLNFVIFLVFIFLCYIIIKTIIENVVMKRRVREICSAKVSMDFIRYLEKYNSDGDLMGFSEYEVFEFFYGKELWWKKFLSAMGFIYFQIQTVDQLKDFFISNLLHKNLANISTANGLNRNFKISKVYHNTPF